MKLTNQEIDVIRKLVAGRIFYLATVKGQTPDKLLVELNRKLRPEIRPKKS